MKRAILACGMVSFAMAFAGTIAAMTLASTVVVKAQDAQLTATDFSVVRLTDGLSVVKAHVAPNGGGRVQIFGIDGETLRIQLVAGGTLGGGVGDAPSSRPAGPPPDPALNAGMNVYDIQGNQVVRVGILPPDLAYTGVQLWDADGNIRYRAALDGGGNPSIQFLDASGNVSWTAP